MLFYIGLIIFHLSIEHMLLAVSVILTGDLKSCRVELIYIQRIHNDLTAFYKQFQPITLGGWKNTICENDQPIIGEDFNG